MNLVQPTICLCYAMVTLFEPGYKAQSKFGPEWRMLRVWVDLAQLAHLWSCSLAPPEPLEQNSGLLVSCILGPMWFSLWESAVTLAA